MKRNQHKIVGLKSQIAEVKNPHYTCLTVQLTGRRKEKNTGQIASACAFPKESTESLVYLFS